MHTVVRDSPGQYKPAVQELRWNHNVIFAIPYRISLMKMMLSLTVFLTFVFLSSFIFEVEIVVLILCILMAKE